MCNKHFNFRKSRDVRVADPNQRLSVDYNLSCLSIKYGVVILSLKKTKISMLYYSRRQNPHLICTRSIRWNILKFGVKKVSSSLLKIQCEFVLALVNNSCSYFTLYSPCVSWSSTLGVHPEIRIYMRYNSIQSQLKYLEYPVILVEGLRYWTWSMLAVLQSKVLLPISQAWRK